MALPPATYDVISRNYSIRCSESCVKMCAWDMRTANENGRWRLQFVSEKLIRKTFWGDGIPRPPCKPEAIKCVSD